MLKMHNIQPCENRWSVIFISYLINGICSVDVCCICFELTKESWIVMDFANNGPFRNEVSETDGLPFENECLDELAEVGSKEGSFWNIWYENFFHQSRSLSTKIIMYKHSRILLHALLEKFISLACMTLQISPFLSSILNVSFFLDSKVWSFSPFGRLLDLLSRLEFSGSSFTIIESFYFHYT